jgi:hypothetical protein
MMIDYEKQYDGVACFTEIDGGDEVFIGWIKPDSEGNYVFHSGIRVILNCQMLKLLSKKIADMNRSR